MNRVEGWAGVDDQDNERSMAVPARAVPAHPVPDVVLDRRHLLLAASASGLVVLTGCSAASTGPGDARGTRGDDGAPKIAAGTVLAKVADVPVGGSISATVSGTALLIAQPTAGSIAVFSAICTHMGCIVDPAGRQFHCPCHGSRYNAATGAVEAGPARAPLPAIAAHIVGGEIVSGP